MKFFSSFFLSIFLIFFSFSANFATATDIENSELFNSICNSSTPLSTSISFNLHIKLPYFIEMEVEKFNEILHSVALNGSIQFNQTNENKKFSSSSSSSSSSSKSSSILIEQPHITLYLTDFNCSFLSQWIPEFSNFTSSLELSNECSTLFLNSLTRNQTYSFWNINDPYQCLQLLSNQTVEKFSKFRSSNISIPEWIYSLPEPLREEKIQQILLWGSPNVFNQFVPHITLFYDNSIEIDGPIIDRTLEQLEEKNIPTRAKFPNNGIEMAIGLTGPYGTVIRGKDLASGIISFQNSIQLNNNENELIVEY